MHLDPPAGRLARDLLVGRLARPLATVVKLDDPHARAMALRGAGLADVHPGDSLAAGRLEAMRRRAFAAAPSAAFRRRAAAGLDRAADALAFGGLLAAWTVGYCLLCPPARAAAATPLLTDERLASFFTWAPLLLVVLFVLALRWRDRGVPAVAEDEAEDDPPRRLSPERRFRDADRG